jgi:hypothetical protein
MMLKKNKIQLFWHICSFKVKSLCIPHLMSKSKKCDLSMTKNTELAIHAFDQVHCWGAYFHLGIGHYENFTP